MVRSCNAVAKFDNSKTGSQNKEELPGIKERL